MTRADRVLDEAWNHITVRSVIRMTDILNLLDEMEQICEKKILSVEYRDFLVEFILDCPSMEISKTQFKELLERLFEMSLNDLFRLGVSANLDRLDDHGLSREFTKSMGFESTRFKTFLANINDKEKIKSLKGRIEELNGMLRKGVRDEKVELKMKSLLVGYFEKLLELNMKQDNISNINEEVVNRLKDSVDRQDKLVRILKNKFNDNEAKWSFIMFYNALKYFGMMLLFLVILSIAVVVTSDYIYDDNNYSDNSYFHRDKSISQ